MNLNTDIYGTTTGGWIVRAAPTSTNRAKYAFVVQRNLQTSIIERAKDHWRYIKEFNIGVLPETASRDGFLLTIRGKLIETAPSLQLSLEALGMDKENAIEAIQIHSKAL